MKIVDWFKNLLSRAGKREYLLNEQNFSTYEPKEKTGFIPKVDSNNAGYRKSREDILRSLGKVIIVEDLSEEYNYTKFSSQNIRENYDENSILSDEDIIALSCLYGAIKDGNKTEEIASDNKINAFLKENSNNIITLINLMIRDAKSMYENLDSELVETISIQGLISGSYNDISGIIEKYDEDKEVTR